MGMLSCAVFLYIKYNAFFSSIIKITKHYFDDLVQDCSKSSALAVDLLQSCTKPSMSPVIHLSQITIYGIL